MCDETDACQRELAKEMDLHDEIWSVRTIETFLRGSVCVLCVRQYKLI